MLQDRDAEFGELLDSRAAVMRRTAYLLCGGDWHRAEDLVRTTLTKIYVAWPRIRRDGSVDAGKVPSGGEPVLSMGKLTFVMVKSGFSVF